MKVLYPYEALLKASTLDDLQSSVRSLAQNLGFASFLYGAYVVSPPDLRSNTEHLIKSPKKQQADAYVLTSYPIQWLQRYEEAGYMAVDPIVQHSQRSILPLVWEKPLAKANPKAEMFFDEAHAHGLISGVSFPVHANTGESAVISLASDLAPKRTRSDSVAAISQAYMLAPYLHEAMRRLSFRKSNAPQLAEPLTPREHECMLWAAVGKTSWEIAQILHISERTANFHISNATRKLNTVNRRQAVARAIALGIIQP